VDTSSALLALCLQVPTHLIPAGRGRGRYVDLVPRSGQGDRPQWVDSLTDVSWPVEQTAPIAARAGPYVTAPHSQRHVRCRPQEHAMLPTSIRPGRNRCPAGQCVGGRTIPCPLVDCTSSPTAAIRQNYSSVRSPCLKWPTLSVLVNVAIIVWAVAVLLACSWLPRCCWIARREAEGKTLA
jgi:hypothetical protein